MHWRDNWKGTQKERDEGYNPTEVDYVVLVNKKSKGGNAYELRYASEIPMSFDA